MMRSTQGLSGYTKQLICDKRGTLRLLRDDLQDEQTMKCLLNLQTFRRSLSLCVAHRRARLSLLICFSRFLLFFFVCMFFL